MAAYTQVPFFNEFHKAFEFNVESLNRKLWPGKEVADILLQRIEVMAPGLTVKIDAETGDSIPLPIQETFIKKFENERSLKRRDLKRIHRGTDLMLPGSKRQRSEENNNISKQVEKFSASNYLPEMTEIEKMNAEQVLERSDESLADAHEVFMETRILQ